MERGPTNQGGGIDKTEKKIFPWREKSESIAEKCDCRKRQLPIGVDGKMLRKLMGKIGKCWERSVSMEADWKLREGS